MDLKNHSKKIILITSGQPSLNPRLVKEADALVSAGYTVTVIYTYWNDWGDRFTKSLLLAKKWNAICAGGHPVKNPPVYFMSKFIHKLAKWGFGKLHFNFFAETAISRGACLLVHEAKKHKADLYIGHNLGALPATVKAAQKYKAKCGFDIEDLHRHEVSDDTNSIPYKTAKYLEDKYFKGLDYLTASSPQIAHAYEHLYPYKKPLTILNVFPKSLLTEQRIFNNCGPTRLFWFSQTLGSNRGLDDIIKALKFLKTEDFELHLLGDIASYSSQQFIADALTGIKNVIFHGPIPPDDIVGLASQFDIGLALEPGFSTNNKLALSNKLFTYLQAGLAIIVSDTIAQRCFMEENPEVGKIYQKDDIQSLVTILADYQLNRELLFTTCKASLKLGREKLNWENESLKFLALVDGVLNEN